MPVQAQRSEPARRRFRPDAPLEKGITLIEASAGTGKTYAITSLLLRLVVEQGLGVEQILVVTFTEAATAELRDRVRRRLRQAAAVYQGQEPAEGDPLLAKLCASSAQAGLLQLHLRRLQGALASFDEAAISTIHGFCHRMLRENAFESGAPFESELLADEARLREEVVQDYWTRELHRADPAFYRFLLHPGRGAPRADPSALSRLAVQVCGEREMPVLPEHPPPAPAPDPEAGRDALQELIRHWKGQQAEIAALLDPVRCAHALYKRYDAGRWPERRAALDRWLAAEPDERTPLPACLDKLRASTLRAQTRKGFAPPRHAFFETCDALALFHQQCGEQLASQALGLLLRFVPYVRAQMAGRKRVARRQSFDDLLHLLARALRGPRGAQLAARISQRFKAALIDEFQDTDPVQYAIFSRVFGGAQGWLFLIGDPKQAIYSFRGADIYAYLRAARDARQRAFTLDTNWRADPPLLQALQRVYERHPLPFADPRIGFHPVRAAQEGGTLELVGAQPPALRIRYVDLAEASQELTGKRQPRIKKDWAWRQLPALVAADIARCLNSGATLAGEPLCPAHLAVLVRKNQQAADIQGALRQLAIPCVLHGASSVFTSSMAEELRLVLAAAAEPSRGAALRTALATDLLGADARQLLVLEEDGEAWEVLAQRFRALCERWRQRGFIQMFHGLLEDFQVHARLLALPDGERRMTNLLHLGELLHGAARRERLGAEGLLRWLDLQRQAGADDAQAAQLRLESDAQAVQVVTIHRSKGLQYPLVWCPYLWDGAALSARERQQVRFHDATDGDRLKLDLGSRRIKRHQARSLQEQRAENLRLAYVALTRAKHQVTLFHGPFSGLGGSALGYLLHPVAGAAPERALDASSRHIKAQQSAGLRAELQQLAAASEGTIQLLDSPALPAERWQQTAPQLNALRARQIRRRPDRGWRISSFSALTREAPRAGPAAEGRDLDAMDPQAQAAGRTSRPPQLEGAGLVPLHAFPRGAQAGSFLHAVLERMDFQERDEAVLDSLVARQLELHGVAPASEAPLVRAALDQVLRTPLYERRRLRLCDVTREQRLDELEFFFPLADPAGRQRLSPAGLAACFQRHPSAAVPASYPQQLAALPFSALAGHMRGFIDLVFCHGERWYLADYKSNHLGDTSADYAPSRLTESMAAHHYLLQYHIYLVALHRYLGWRLPDYDYQRHFGGVLYLYLRGMSPASGASCGVFRDRPALELVRALSQALAPRERP